jgi:diacylglycerol kinase family enzyme
MKVAVLMNKGAGSFAGVDAQKARSQVVSAFERRGIGVELHSPAAGEIPVVARRLAGGGLDAVVAGGGDGTISSVAEALVSGSLPLGVLPMGTRNNFARDLGIPLELEGAVEVIAGGRVCRIDVAEVNGRFFINNSSIGTYPRAVLEREEDRKKFGLPKWLATVIAVLKVFRRQPLLRIRFELDGKAYVRSTPFLFVGNNLYAVNLFEVKFRSCLTDGKLCVYCTNCDGFGCLLGLFWQALWNRLDQADDFEMHTGSELLVYPGRRRIRVAKDGEVIRLETPLRYVVHRAGLPVIMPVSSE